MVEAERTEQYGCVMRNLWQRPFQKTLLAHDVTFDCKLFRGSQRDNRIVALTLFVFNF